MKRMLISLALGAAVTFGTTMPVATAQSWAPSYERGQKQQVVPLKTVQRGLQRRYGGYLLSARESQGKYYIKWLTDKGRALNIVVDAKSGRILSTSGA